MLEDTVKLKLLKLLNWWESFFSFSDINFNIKIYKIKIKI